MKLKTFEGKYTFVLGDDWEEALKANVCSGADMVDDPEENLSIMLNDFADRDRYMDFQQFDMFCKIFQIMWYKEFEDLYQIPLDIRSYGSTCRAAVAINHYLAEEGWLFKVRIYDNAVLASEDKKSHGEYFNNHWYRLERI